MPKGRPNWEDDSEMWPAHEGPYPRTDGDAMFEALLDALDQLEKDNPNLVGLARHQAGPHESRPLEEPSKIEMPTPEVTEQGVVGRYFRNLFKRQG